MTPPTAPGAISLPRFFIIWLALGAQSFGGGPTTLTLIRRAAVEQHLWLTEEEFSRFWALVLIVPGINLIALTILIGKKVAGMSGVALAIGGLLLPTASLTIAMTATYTRIQHSPVMQAALRGMIPATVGLGLLATAQIALPFLRTPNGRPRAAVIPWWLLLTAAGAAAGWGVPVLGLLIAGGLIGALIYRRPIPAEPDAP
jgi:chromate transporter